jgi:hypothetical protein
MLVQVTIKKNGERTHEVLQRDANENCQRIHVLNTSGSYDEERTGPDCDEVLETQ